MCKYCVTDIVQKDLRCRLTVLNCGENGHPQMFERCVHLTMGPTERIRHGNSVFVSKLFTCHARYIELHDFNRTGKERNWVLFEIEDRHSSRRSFPSAHQFSREPQTASLVRAKMQVD
jgi:hypothetical protein